MNPLKLIALDQDDIAIVSTHLQDAVVKIADIVWLPAEKRLVLGVNRFDWEACGCEDPCYKRRRTALRFERVHSLRCRNVDPKHIRSEPGGRNGGRPIAAAEIEHLHSRLDTEALDEFLTALAHRCRDESEIALFPKSLVRIDRLNSKICHVGPRLV